MAFDGAPYSTKKSTYHSYVCPHHEYKFDIDESKKTGCACVLLHQVLGWEESPVEEVRHRMVAWWPRLPRYLDVFKCLTRSL